MCFVKSSPVEVPQVSEPVEIKQADADKTKNSQNTPQKSAFEQNVRTSAFGLEDNLKTNKKTLLGE